MTSRFSSYLTLGGTETNGSDALLADLWPIGDDPPFIWLITPVRYGWIGRARVNVQTRRNNANLDEEREDMAVFGVLPYTLTINDVPFDVGRYRTSLARPVDDPDAMNEATLRFLYRYAGAPPAVPVVTRVDP